MKQYRNDETGSIKISIFCDGKIISLLPCTCFAQEENCNEPLNLTRKCYSFEIKLKLSLFVTTPVSWRCWRWIVLLLSKIWYDTYIFGSSMVPSFSGRLLQMLFLAIFVGKTTLLLPNVTKVVSPKMLSLLRQHWSHLETTLLTCRFLVAFKDDIAHMSFLGRT